MYYIPWYIACYITGCAQAGLLDPPGAEVANMFTASERLIQEQSMSVELLELLKSNMQDKTGEKSGWNFEKVHSILHKVQLPVCYYVI